MQIHVSHLAVTRDVFFTRAFIFREQPFLVAADDAAAGQIESLEFQVRIRCTTLHCSLSASSRHFYRKDEEEFCTAVCARDFKLVSASKTISFNRERSAIRGGGCASRRGDCDFKSSRRRSITRKQEILKQHSLLEPILV